MKRKFITILLAALLYGSGAVAQSMLDLSIGTSNADQAFLNIAYRKAKNDKLRYGLEAQFASVSYRLIDAKTISKGTAISFGIPITIRMYQKDKLRLDFYTKAGMRLLNTDEKEQGTTIEKGRSSSAFTIEPGLLVTASITEKFNFQSGLTVPTIFQVSPTSFLENVYPLLVHVGVNKQLGENKILFLKAAFGPATGGNGDTQKFHQSIQAGVRLNFNNDKTPNFVEPSF
jgi:hypothetical protein